MKYLLDTNTVSYYLRGDEGVVKKLQKTKPSDLAVSAVTVMELTYGVIKRDSKKLNDLVQKFLKDITVLSFDEESASHAGTIRAKLDKKGIAISIADSQIAGHARSLKMTLITSDSDFKNVPQLKTANWQNEV